VEVDLEKGLPKDLQINLDGWSHHQALDYEHIPFKCFYFHAYGHFAKSYPKSQEEQPPLKQQLRKELEFNMFQAGKGIFSAKGDLSSKVSTRGSTHVR
jgi:hypothetical protein